MRRIATRFAPVIALGVIAACIDPSSDATQGDPSIGADAAIDGARIEGGADGSQDDARSEAAGADAAPDASTCSTYTDISSGQGVNASVGAPSAGPSAVIDAVNGKLLVVIDTGLLFRCNLDGSACTYANISAGQGSTSGFDPSAVIDAANAKLLVVTRNSSNAQRPAFFRCNLDGSACTHTDGSAGASTGYHPSAVIDAVNGKLLAVTTDKANAGKPGLFRCNLDGTACEYTDISAGQGTDSGYFPSAVIDAANGKLLVVTQNRAMNGTPGLFRCELDGSACNYVDISVGQGAESGGSPSSVIDAVNGKLLVVTQNGASSEKPALFRCNLDGSACTYTDISAGQGAWSGSVPSAVIDSTTNKLLVVTKNGANGDKPALFRCNLDGSACTHSDVSAGQGFNSGSRPSAVLDAMSGKLLVATRNGANSGKPALFSVCVK